MQKETYTLELGGKTLTAEFTDLANQAHGSVMLRLGDTLVLATAVMSSTAREGGDYFPLSVEYEEKFYAAGQILGSRFMRREGKPSDEAVLSGRAVDRTIRPLFDGRIRNDVQVVITVLSLGEEDPDVLAINAASLAIATSDIPWNGPVGAVRIGKTNGELIVNPTYTNRQDANAMLDLLVCGRDEMINMIEVGAHEVKEDKLVEALTKGSEEIEKLVKWQEEIVAKRGVEKRMVVLPEASDEMKKLFDEIVRPRFGEIFENGKSGISALQSAWNEAVAEAFPDARGVAELHFEAELDHHIHREALDTKRRVDGRAFDKIRPLFAQAGGVSNMLHGSGIFYRGETHVLSALTLGGPDDSQLIDGMEEQTKKHYMHHYNFPPFSTGETGRVGGFNRRMIGHGALAEKALIPVLPKLTDFPYTIRVVSEAFASNGSTSMASVCGSTLALMDAGVPITSPVAGISIGLMMDPDSKDKNRSYELLTDIQGPEDHYGDMDFKVAGTEAGVTAVQMDIKLGGVPVSVLAEAFARAKEARMQILEVITNAIPAPRADISPYAPKILVMQIKTDQIGLVIGSGGKTVNGIKDETGAEITLEDDGTMFIVGKNGSAERAREMIAALVKEYHAGEEYDGEVTRLMDFGAFVKIGPGPHAEGLVHVSEIAPFRIGTVSDALSEGETVPVVVKEIDEKGRINLSIKARDPEWAVRKGLTASPAGPAHNGPRYGERPPHSGGRPPHHGPRPPHHDRRHP